jgi:hypothetical protein
MGTISDHVSTALVQIQLAPDPDTFPGVTCFYHRRLQVTVADRDMGLYVTVIIKVLLYFLRIDTRTWVIVTSTRICCATFQP